MAHETDLLVQLATRVPAELHRSLRVHCAANERTVQSFVVDALREKVAKTAPRASRGDAGGRAAVGVLAAVALALAASADAATIGLHGRAAACSAGWDTGAAAVASSRAAARVLCHDGDPTCDADGVADGACTVDLRACVGLADAACTPEPVSRLRVSRNARRLPGFTAPDPAAGGCGSAGGAHLALRGRTRSRPSRPMTFVLRARTAGGKGTSRVRVQCLPAATTAAACPDREAPGLPKTYAFAIGAGGSDLDNGWTGVSHDFPLVQGTQLALCLSGCDGTTNPVCAAHGDVGAGTRNGATFGPPLPLLAVGVPVCLVNRYAGPVDGTVDLATGAFDGSLALASDVYTMTPSNAVCPRCDNDVDPASAIGTSGRCVGGATPGAACTVEGVQTVVGSGGDPVYKLSSACLPAAGLAATLSLHMPLTTGSASLDGRCPGQQHDDGCGGGGTCTGSCSGPATCASKDALGRCVDLKGGIAQTCCSNDGNKSCFPTATGPVVRTGSPAALQPAWPEPSYPKSAHAVLAATFCEPATGDPTVDGLTGLPAPGAALLDGSVHVGAQD